MARPTLGVGGPAQRAGSLGRIKGTEKKWLLLLLLLMLLAAYCLLPADMPCTVSPLRRPSAMPPCLAASQLWTEIPQTEPNKPLFL